MVMPQLLVSLPQIFVFPEQFLPERLPRLGTAEEVRARQMLTSSRGISSSPGPS